MIGKNFFISSILSENIPAEAWSVCADIEIVRSGVSTAATHRLSNSIRVLPVSRNHEVKLYENIQSEIKHEVSFFGHPLA